MLKVIAKNYYTKDDYHFLEELLRYAYCQELRCCKEWHKNCRECTTQKACKDIKQLIDYLYAINK